jgi:Arc/MetJ-type ribon-helix-helix transcriptional regulator
MGKNSNLIVFRVPEEIRKRIDALVENGIYKTKSEIINEALRNFFGINKMITSKRVKKK